MTWEAPAPNRLPDSLLFRARSTEYLPRYHRKRCAPNLGKWLLSLENAKNCNAWRVLANPTSSDPLQHDYAHSKREPLPNLAPWPMRSYPSAPLLLRSLGPCSLGKRRFLRGATRTWPQKSDT